MRKSTVLHLPASERLAASLDIVKRHVAQNGIESVNRQAIVEGFHIGHWVCMRRMDYHRGQLPDWLKNELDALPGWTWNPIDDARRRNLAILQRFVKKHGMEALNQRTEFEGVLLGSWAQSSRKCYEKGTLPDWLTKEFEKLPGWQWNPENPKRAKLRLLKEFIAEHGWEEFHTRLEYKGQRIGSFVQSRRNRYLAGKMSPDEAKELAAIPGWTWRDDRRRQLSQRRLKLLKQFVLENGWEPVNWRLVIDDEPIGTWMLACRTRRKKGNLSAWLAEELEKTPGWQWQA